MVASVLMDILRVYRLIHVKCSDINLEKLKIINVYVKVAIMRKSITLSFFLV